MHVLTSTFVLNCQDILHLEGVVIKYANENSLCGNSLVWGFGLATIMYGFHHKKLITFFRVILKGGGPHVTMYETMYLIGQSMLLCESMNDVFVLNLF